MSSAQAQGTNPETQRGVLDARLVNGDTRCSGHLEMKHQGQWRTLRIREDSSSHAGFAQMACHQMDCGSVVTVEFLPNATEPKPAWGVHFTCAGFDQTIRECRVPASRQKVDDVEAETSSVMVKCAETVRMTSEDTSCYGTVKAKFDHEWHDVCAEDGFDSHMMSLMCSELSCGSVRGYAISTQRNGVESRNIQCVRNETQLEQCLSTRRSVCKKLLLLSCNDLYRVRAVGGDGQCSGLLQGQNGVEWRPLTHREPARLAIQLRLRPFIRLLQKLVTCKNTICPGYKVYRICNAYQEPYEMHRIS
ncbi:hypothetical protein WMY93_005431 [Mugilogobius chulae]|uniref:SRCR domain-containing protein n=1 Tax=Mugilogobius chulae TaxID=88201 RepID=A0AAW0PT68_9GOBI